MEKLKVIFVLALMAIAACFFDKAKYDVWLLTVGISEKRWKKDKETYAYLTKYVYALKNEIPNNLAPNGKYRNCIWTLWLQGEEKAPGIVKTCLKSIRKYSSGRQVVVLDEANIDRYIQLPKYIIAKYRNGQITRPFFSDIVRCCLLYKYGGTWIDSTVLLTGELPEEITRCRFFVFQIPKSTCRRETFAAVSWFIHAEPGCVIMKDLINLCFEYWRREEKLRDYFVIYFFMKLVVENDPEARRIFDDMPYYIEKLHFYPCLVKPFDEKLFEKLKHIGDFPINKVTYRRFTKKKPNEFFLYDYLNDENFDENKI